MATVDPEAFTQLLAAHAALETQNEQRIANRIAAARAEKGSALTLVEEARAAFGRNWRD